MAIDTINVRQDLATFRKSLNRYQEREFPFAAALSLTKLAKKAVQFQTRKLPVIFDRPTPYTKRAVGSSSATKNRLWSVVFVKDKQSKYLDVQVTGGRRIPQGEALGVPVKAAQGLGGMKFNKYGNLPRGKIKALYDKPGIIHGGSNKGEHKAGRNLPPGLYFRKSTFKKAQVKKNTGAKTAKKRKGGVKKSSLGGLGIEKGAVKARSRGRGKAKSVGKDRIVRLVTWRKSTNYRKRWNFGDMNYHVYKKWYPRILNEALNYAMKTSFKNSGGGLGKSFGGAAGVTTFNMKFG